uniref:Uncharacterized protein n=1 Tax=Angiostrongylus cantonensis TaxID=6313 RepID=A0A0K0DI16_ANGCA
MFFFSKFFVISNINLFCPVPIVGTRCPGSSVFHYYKCCGDMNKDCCFNLQVLISIFRILDDGCFCF